MIIRRERDNSQFHIKFLKRETDWKELNKKRALENIWFEEKEITLPKIKLLYFYAFNIISMVILYS